MTDRLPNELSEGERRHIALTVKGKKANPFTMYAEYDVLYQLWRIRIPIQSGHNPRWWSDLFLVWCDDKQSAQSKMIAIQAYMMKPKGE